MDVVEGSGTEEVVGAVEVALAWGLAVVGAAVVAGEVNAVSDVVVATGGFDCAVEVASLALVVPLPSSEAVVMLEVER